MVKMEQERLVIEIETPQPESYVVALANALGFLVIGIDPERYERDEAYTIMTLINALYPSFEQMKKLKVKKV